MTLEERVYVSSWQSASYIIGSQLLTPFSPPRAQEEFQHKQTCRVSLVVPRTCPAGGLTAWPISSSRKSVQNNLAWMWSCSKETLPAHS